MKKLTKVLFPIALPATLVVPTTILASCDTNWVEPINMVDIYKTDEKGQSGYVYEPDPSLPYPEGHTWTQAEAIENYITAVNENPTLFQDDMLAAARLNVVPFIKDAAIYDMQECSFGFSKPTFGKTTVWEWGFEPISYNTISFTQKVHVVFTQDNLSDKETQTCDLNIKYNNVIFFAYEDMNDDAGGWHIGLLDETLGAESIWPYSRNENPWSINYDCKLLSKRVISFEDPIEPIIINNCHYYSGIVDNSTKLRVFYEASVIPTTDEPIIDYIGSNVGLLLRHKSYYLSNVDSCPDIGLSEQLHCSIDPNETIVEILGFKLIKSKDTLQSFEKFEIVSDSEIIFSEIDGDHKIYLGTWDSAKSRYSVELKRDGTGFALKTQEGTLKLGNVPIGYDESESGTNHSFVVPVSQFKVEIKLFGVETPIETFVRLHYSTMIVHVNDTSNSIN